jgi:hypothetical protein
MTDTTDPSGVTDQPGNDQNTGEAPGSEQPELQNAQEDRPDDSRDGDQGDFEGINANIVDKPRPEGEEAGLQVGEDDPGINAHIVY